MNAHDKLTINTVWQLFRVVHVRLTYQEDVNSTSLGEDDDCDGEEEERIPVKRIEALHPVKRTGALHSVDVLRRALEENEVGDQYLYFQTLHEIETRLLSALPQKQSLITDFFRKSNVLVQ